MNGITILLALKVPRTQEPGTQGPKNQGPEDQTPEDQGPKDQRTRDPRTRHQRTRDPRTRHQRTRDPRTRHQRTRDPRTRDPRTRDPRCRLFTALLHLAVMTEGQLQATCVDVLICNTYTCAYSPHCYTHKTAPYSRLYCSTLSANKFNPFSLFKT